MAGNAGIGLIFVVVAVVVAAVIYFTYTRQEKPTDDNGGGGSGGDSGGGGTVEPTPATYPIANRPTPDGKDPTDDIPEGHEFPELEIHAFVENWSVYKVGDYKLDLAKMPLTPYALALYSFFGVADDGRILYSDQWGDYNLGQLDGFLAQAKAAGTRAGVSIGGYTYSSNDTSITSHRFSTEFEKAANYNKKLTGAETWNLVLNDATVGRTFVEGVGALCKKHGFTHVDIDYEYPNCPGGECDTSKYDQRAGYVTLISSLVNTYPDLTFSIDISPNRFKLQAGTDLASLNKLAADTGRLTIQIMSYDYHVFDPRPNASTGHNQTLTPGHSAYVGYNVQDTIEYISSQENYDGKFYAIGFAAYGRGFPLSQEAYDAAKATKNFSYLPYESTAPQSWAFTASALPGVVFIRELGELKSKIDGGGVNYVAGDGGWLLYSDGPGIFSIPTPESVNAIRWMAEKVGITKAILWTATQDKTTDSDGFVITNLLKMNKYDKSLNISLLPSTPSSNLPLVAAPADESPDLTEYKRTKRRALKPSSLLSGTSSR